MLVFKIFIGCLLCFLGSGINFDEVFNYNGHSYYFSSTTYWANYIQYYCSKGGHYAADITNSSENAAIASILREDFEIGIYQDYNGKLYSSNSGKLATYTNIDPNSLKTGYKAYFVMKSSNGKWTLDYYWSYHRILCEDDKISSSGVNITGDKIINIKYDDLLSYRGHTYYIYGVYRDYATTIQICDKDHNGYIFIPNDGLENCAINTENHGFVYVGITQRKKKFPTEKGYDTSYLPWAPRNPTKETCVTRSHQNGEFFSDSCYEKKHIICESDSVIANTNPVDCNYTRKHFYFAQILQYNGYSIRIFDFKTSFSDAKELCSRRNDVLFAPLDQTENCAVMENTEFTLGLNYGQIYVKNVMVRGDEFKDNYTNWASGYPVSDDSKACVYASYNSGKWKNDVCKNISFSCRERQKNTPSSITCSKNYYEIPNDAYSFEIFSKTYSMFGRLLSYHDSVRLCSYYGQSLIQTTESSIIKKLTKNLIDINMHVDYRIMWSNTSDVTWLDESPSGNVNWAHGEPKSNDFLISCVSVAPNNTYFTNSCFSKYVTVCVGNDSPTRSTTTSKTTPTTTSTTTTTTTTTPTTTTTTTPKTTQKTASSTPTSLASKQTNNVEIGVGIFFGILAIIGIGLGVFIYKKRGLSLSLPDKLSSFGSFRARSFEH